MPTKESRLRRRWAFDDRGHRIWEWETQPGVFSTNIDTTRVKALVPADLSIDVSQRQKALHFNPYDTGVIQRPPKGRTLDDMRKLNDEIKRSKRVGKSDD